MTREAGRRGLLNIIWSAMVSDRRVAMGVAILGFFVLMAIVGPYLVRDPTAFIGQPHQPPTNLFWFGTTGQGQDVFAQTVVGARMTLLLGLAVGTVVTMISALVGISAGYFGGRVDDLLSLLTNVFLVIPGLPLAIVIAAYLPAGPETIALALVITGWSFHARVLRGQALTLRNRDFVKAAIIAGESHVRIILVEILPNMLSLMVSGLIGSTFYAIGAQVGLEYLGLGDVSTVTWGTNLYWASNDQALLTQSWWTFLPTGLAIALVGFALTLINFGIDEITNPTLRAERVWRKYLKGQLTGTKGSTPVVRLP